VKPAAIPALLAALLLAGCAMRRVTVRQGCLVPVADVHRVCDRWMSGPQVHLERWGDGLVCVEDYSGASAYAVAVPETQIHCEAKQ